MSSLLVTTLGDPKAERKLEGLPDARPLAPALAPDVSVISPVQEEGGLRNYMSSIVNCKLGACVCDETGSKIVLGKHKRSFPLPTFKLIKLKLRKAKLRGIEICSHSERWKKKKQVWQLENRRKEMDHYGVR